MKSRERDRSMSFKQGNFQGLNKHSFKAFLPVYISLWRHRNDFGGKGSCQTPVQQLPLLGPSEVETDLVAPEPKTKTPARKLKAMMQV